MMGAKIKFKNLKSYQGDTIADPTFVINSKKLKSIELDPKFNSSAIISNFYCFIFCLKRNNEFKNLQELNKKESKRLDWGFKILTLMGVKTKKIGRMMELKFGEILI